MDNPGWHAQRHAHEVQKAYAQRHRTRDGRYFPVEQVGPMAESSIGGSLTEPQHPPRITPNQLTRMTPAERSQYYRVAHMTPPLQFMCGPLLKYDTVVDSVWYGAALIVTADSGSAYSPAPTLTYEWDPSKPSSTFVHPEGPASAETFELGPHPADPQATTPPMVIADEYELALNGTLRGPNTRMKQVEGQEIFVYADQAGSFTFWRFFLEIPLGNTEMKIIYHINKGQRMNFYVPGSSQNMRWAAHSCNGFSAGVNPDDFKGPGYQSGYDPLWVDLLQKHSAKPFHVIVGGGDQLYCDRLMLEPEIQDWSDLKPQEKKEYLLTERLSTAIDRFFFNHYCQQFRRGAFARANCSIPMLNMCDDHDLIDGFDPDEWQRAPVFQEIGARGYFFYLLFQHFLNVTIDGTDDRPEQHILKSLIIGDRGPYVRLPSHSFISYLGPQCSMLLLDCRAERTLHQVCSSVQYKNVFSRLSKLPHQLEHLIVQSGIPIAYPRMVFLETALGSKFNPLVALGKAGHLGSIGLSGFANKFNADAELLDDLNDHWTSRLHKKERNWLVEQLQMIARTQRLRISFLSGDVHCAAVGLFKTLKPKTGSEIQPENDFRYMINITSSAIVNTPPPAAVIAMVSSLATKTHKSLHHIETDETMLPVFPEDPDRTQRKQKHIMGRRNWCQVDWEPMTGFLVFVLRVEQEKGVGRTVGYEVRVPPPTWVRGQQAS